MTVVSPKLSSDARVAIGSTIFALASSASLYLLPQLPIDPHLRGTFRLWQGNAYVIVVKYTEGPLTDARLYEDGKPLGPSNSDPQEIWTKGSGRFRLYRDPTDYLAPILMFSSSDNTDPNTNGRKYRLE
ncbi:hypothetical protein ABIB82_007584 [Bradyrhizobium sp. i1.8.4]|uniref:hypothetical protein n=1 Tax=unclassified Bradyrhizobium TaxID=2631580 RepID=UPI003D1D03DA